MKAFEEQFPKPDKIQVYYYPKELTVWEARQEGYKGALEWVLRQKYVNPESPTISNPDGHSIIDAVTIEEELK